MKFSCSYCRRDLDTEAADPDDQPIIVANDEDDTVSALCADHAYMIPNGDDQ